MHAVGEVAGLHLCVKPTGARSWVLRTTIGGRRAELGVGGYPTTTLAQARERARKLLDSIRDGADPVAERRSLQASSEWTFKRAAERYIETHRAEWRNAKHAAQWTATLTAYVYPKFGAKHVRDVTRADVLGVIEPLWTTKHETAARLRSRIELVLRWATTRGHRPEGPNAAELKGLGLPKAGKVAKVKHHAALPVDDMHGFMERLRAVEGMGARALEFAILCAARSGEVRGAVWGEIDLANAVWNIPGERMKAGRPHRVPLSTRALELLEALPRFTVEPGAPDYVFPGTKGGPLSDMTLTACTRRLGVAAVPHGFRSTFADWCSERTATTAAVRETALAHAVGDKTTEAYLRSDLFAARADLMEKWARFIDTPPARGNVRALRAAKGAA